jgi:cyclohexanone monooxygenase
VTDRPTPHGETSYDILVIGAGFAGLYALHRLRQLGLSIHAVERGDGVGGVWYWNRYPGARVDSPSLEYSYSFSPELEQEWHWSEKYATQPEIEAYANHVADRFDLRELIDFGVTVTSASFDEQQQRWTVVTDQGTISARFLVAAAGTLSATNVPPIPGLDSFQGQWLHAAQWPDEGVDVTGRRVGVIGTGSTGIQMTPMLAQDAEQLYVFQRTAHYALPANNGPLDPEFEREWKASYREHRAAARQTKVGFVGPEFPDRSAFSVSPEEREAVYESQWGNHQWLLRSFNDLLTDLAANETASEFIRDKVRARIKDPAVAELLTPRDYPYGAKRTPLDSDYYEAFNRDNVTLVDVKTDPIVEITPTGVRTGSDFYELDTIVFATGYDALTGPLVRLNLTGVDDVRLEDKWDAGPRSYLGIVTAGFPNLFTITGPGSPSVLANMVLAIEQHVDLAADLISQALEQGAQTVDADPQAEHDWVEHVNEAAATTLYMHAKSWYLGANVPGKPQVFLPYVGGLAQYIEKCDAVAEADYAGFVFR